MGGNLIKMNNPANGWKSGGKRPSKKSWGGAGSPEYAEFVFGKAGAQVNDGMGGNLIKMNNPANGWKSGGGDSKTIITNPDKVSISNGSLVVNDGGTSTTFTGSITISGDVSTPTTTTTTATASSAGGGMLGAAIVPAALLVANQLYKPRNSLRKSRKYRFKKNNYSRRS